MRSHGIPTRPYLKPWYRIARAEERLVLEYGQAVAVFEGKAVQRLLPALLPLLDGTRSVKEISAVLGEPIRPAVDKALDLLAEAGLLTEGPALAGETPAPFVHTTHFLSASAVEGPPISEISATLHRARVGIAGAGVCAEEIARLLRLSGIDEVERLSEGAERNLLEALDLIVLAPTAHELPDLADWNRCLLAAGTAWLQVLPFDGKFAAIGPLYLPGETCCYECYRLRRLSNLDYGDEFMELERQPARYPEAPSLAAAIVGISATLALRWIARRDQVLPGAFYALEHGATIAVTFHRVYRVPRCPVCSGLDGIASPLPWFKEANVVRH
jgi:bacteriocin biosynthesis cyclodehydratase domain-containing protein